MDTKCVLCGGPVIREVEIASGIYAGMCAHHLEAWPAPGDAIDRNDLNDRLF